MPNLNTRVPVSEMSAYVELGEATPLFPEYAVGPAWYAGRWWHVPRDGDHEHYVPASDELSLRFGDLFARHVLAYETLGEHMARDAVEPPEWTAGRPDQD